MKTMTTEQAQKYIILLRLHLDDCERCIKNNQAGLDGAQVAAANQIWNELHAEDGPIDILTVD
jgi:hypothetical protein